MSVQEKIQEQVNSHDIVLYMKGLPHAPQCGFSAKAVQVLQLCGVEEIFAIDVLADYDVRQGIKTFSNWPTIPQLYVKGEFVGGSDIMIEMFENGELQELLKN